MNNVVLGLSLSRSSCLGSPFLTAYLQTQTIFSYLSVNFISSILHCSCYIGPAYMYVCVCGSSCTHTANELSSWMQFSQWCDHLSDPLQRPRDVWFEVFRKEDRSKDSYITCKDFISIFYFGFTFWDANYRANNSENCSF